VQKLLTRYHVHWHFSTKNWHA